MVHKILSLLLMCLVSVGSGFAQQAEGLSTHTGAQQGRTTLSLLQEISLADSLLFTAFNNCDSLTYRQYFTDDLEFYHDLGGLTKGIDNELKSFKEMCERGNHIRRELIKSTHEVYPLKGFGAVQIGVHRFYHTNKGESEKISGTYKFVQVWQFTDNRWKISRIISYGHDQMSND